MNIPPKQTRLDVIGTVYLRAAHSRAHGTNLALHIIFGAPKGSREWQFILLVYFDAI